MKILFCLFALLAVALARPQNLPFFQEGLSVGSRLNFLSPDEQLLDSGVIPLVNELEDVPISQSVDLQRFLGDNEGALSSNLQRSVDQLLG